MGGIELSDFDRWAMRESERRLREYYAQSALAGDARSDETAKTGSARRVSTRPAKRGTPNG